MPKWDVNHIDLYDDGSFSGFCTRTTFVCLDCFVMVMVLEVHLIYLLLCFLKIEVIGLSFCML